MSRNTRRKTREYELQEALEGSSSTPSSATMEELLERLLHMQTRHAEPKFKPPTYRGDIDVELFIHQFCEVMTANQWSGRDATLHLRACLEGSTAECGRGQTVDEIIANLRARYGLSAKQARDKLSTIRKKAAQSFHDLGAEITKLVHIAYPRLDEAFHTETSLEVFNRALHHRSMQQHLLARPHTTISEAVRIAEEFLQVESGKTSLAVMSTEQEPEEDSNSEIKKMIKEMQELIKNQNVLMGKLTQAQTPTTHGWQGTQQGPAEQRWPRKQTQAPIAQGWQSTQSTRGWSRGPCFKCGGPHLRRECPQESYPSIPARTTAESGKGNGQSQ